MLRIWEREIPHRRVELRKISNKESGIRIATDFSIATLKAKQWAVPSKF